MEIYQCPECELRFRNASELESHLKLDHPDFNIESDSLEDFAVSEAHRHRHSRRRQYRPREDN
ncbi:MAG: C2H2-type zinc finger protein [Actinomycetota bacterium]